MDFHSLTRRDLQSLCKMNKIPANKTNLAMADALSSLEIVEGLDEYLKQSDSKVPQSPTSVAKLPPNTATRTTRRKTAVKAEPHRSCRLTSKKSSIDGEIDQENVAEEAKTDNVKFEANVAKTPAARSTRKVQESKKKDELVQSAYSTRRSTRLLEKCMADLSLKTKVNLDKPEKIEESEPKVSAQEKKPAGSEERIGNTEVVVPGRDLSASMEKEWEMLKHDSDQVTGDLGDNAVSDANTETNNEEGNEDMSDEKESENSIVQVNKQEEALQADKAVSEEGLKQNGNDQETEDTEIYADLIDIPVLEQANTETFNNNKESKNVQAFDSLVQVEHQETKEVIQENVSETEKTTIFDEEEAVVDRTDGVSEAEEENSGVDSEGTISEAGSNQAGNKKAEQATQKNDSETEKINTFDEDRMVDQNDGDSETEPEGDTEIYVDLGDNSVLEHANSEIINDNKESKNAQAFDSFVQVEHQGTEEAIQENDTETEKTNTFDVVDRTDGDSAVETKEDGFSVDSDVTISEADLNQADDQETEHAIQKNDSEIEKTNIFDEEAVVDRTEGDSEAEPEEDNSGVDSDGTISEADLNQADNKKTEQAIKEKDSETEKTNAFDEEAVVDQNDGDSESELEEDSSGVDSDRTISEADSNQADDKEAEHAVQENDPETEKINTFVEDTMVDQTDSDVEGGHSGVDSDVTISEVDIAEEEVILSESEGSVTAPTSPPLSLEEVVVVNTAPLSPFVAESISAQFPRPNKSASKNSAMKLVGNTNKENNMEMMMNFVNSDDNGESKGERKKKKKVEIDEETLKDVSMRQLVKMVKELSIKSTNNRAALQILPGNNQIAK